MRRVNVGKSPVTYSYRGNVISFLKRGKLSKYCINATEEEILQGEPEVSISKYHEWLISGEPILHLGTLFCCGRLDWHCGAMVMIAVTLAMRRIHAWRKDDF